MKCEQCSRLSEATEKLKQERDAATEQMRQHWVENGKLEAKLERLSEAVMPYLQHKAVCALITENWKFVDIERECTCGLEDVLTLVFLWSTPGRGTVNQPAGEQP